MPYHLLTGASGLLGTYLLRDGLAAGLRIAVVVRPSIAETPRQRIETILARWEREIGYALPRPPVLDGDICQPDLGLSPGALKWVAENCLSVVHNAASLSFQADQRSGEPYRSNVQGTGHVLDLCRKIGIRQFHHVSTAYVCGLRKGRVFESELDVGQELGNDYEKSKVQAEKMVRQADFLAAPTIYRPAIIVGDSATGYTSTFHGFYTPLKVAQALVDRYHLTEIDSSPVMAALGLSGHERKHFVPVDWVSRAITHLLCRPEHHGRTYHIALASPVAVDLACEVMVQSIREYSEAVRDKTPRALQLADLQNAFLDQMGVYRAYWRDDPEFDQANLAQAAPHLLPGEVGSEMLLRMSRYAFGTNFGWPRPQPRRPEFDVQTHLNDLLPREPFCEGAATARVGLQVNGPGGGQWTLLVDNGRLAASEIGITPDRDSLLYLNSATFRQCVLGQLTPQRAAQLGQVAIEGNHVSRDQLLSVLHNVLQSAAAADAARPLAASAAAQATGSTS